jgi:disulfide bond formation protein DsbB
MGTTYNRQARTRMLIVAGGSLLALVAAYAGEYFFGLQPCLLCKYQQWIYIILISTSIIGIALKHWYKLVLDIISIIIMVGIIVALYQLGVENGLFKGPSACQEVASNKAIKDLKEVKAEIIRPKVPACSKPAFEFMYISIAGWNVLFLLCLFYVASGCNKED